MKFVIATALALALVAQGAGGAFAAGTATPLAAVKILATRPSPCIGTVVKTWYSAARGCPVTTRLSHRLQTVLRHERGVDPVCRCQNVARMSYVVSTAGTRAYVTAAWHFKPVERITFVVLRRGIRWLVDDFYCAGRPNTSVYKKAPLAYCPTG